MMTVLFINTSIDPVDPEGDWVPEDLSVNEMETITEFVMEKVLGIDDCFQEKDDDDPDNSTGVHIVKDFSQYVHVQYAIVLNPVELAETCPMPDYFKRFNSQFISEINAPPPKLAA